MGVITNISTKQKTCHKITIQKNYKIPEVLEPIGGKVPNCSNCNVLFQEPVSTNEDYLYPKCNQPFNVMIKPESKQQQEKE